MIGQWPPPNDGKPWTLKEDERLRRLEVDFNGNAKKIGEQLGRTGMAVNARLRIIRERYKDTKHESN